MKIQARISIEMIDGEYCVDLHSAWGSVIGGKSKTLADGLAELADPMTGLIFSHITSGTPERLIKSACISASEAEQ